jgi:hypothetical protein
MAKKQRLNMSGVLKHENIPSVKIDTISKEQIEGEYKRVYKFLAEEYEKFLIKDMGFDKFVKLKHDCELPDNGQDKVLYVLPSKVLLFWNDRSNTYKKFSIDKWLKKSNRSYAFKMFFKEPIRYTLFRIRKLFTK